MESTEVIEVTIGGGEVEDRRGGEHRAECHRRDEDQTDDGEGSAGKEPHSLFGGLRGVRGARPAGPVSGRNGLV